MMKRASLFLTVILCVLSSACAPKGPEEVDGGSESADDRAAAVTGRWVYDAPDGQGVMVMLLEAGGTTDAGTGGLLVMGKGAPPLGMKFSYALSGTDRVSFTPQTMGANPFEATRVGNELHLQSPDGQVKVMRRSNDPKYDQYFNALKLGIDREPN